MAGRWTHVAVGRGDLRRAAEEAASHVGDWSGYGAKVRTTWTFRSGLSEESDAPDAIAKLHRGDLAEIAQIRFEVRGDDAARWREQDRLSSEWLEARHRASERGEEQEDTDRPEAAPIKDASVTISLPWGGSGLQVEVTGPDRAGVEGLFQRIAGLLAGRQSFRRVGPRELFLTVGIPLAGALMFVGGLVPRWIDADLDNRRFDWQEVLGMLAGLTVGAVTLAVVAWLYPTMQLLEDGERSRAERFRWLLLGAVGTLVASIAASALYGLLQ